MANTLFTDATIITVDPSRRVILRGYLLVQDSRITHVGAHPPARLPEDTRSLSLPGRIIIPGLINTHVHLGQSLLRGLAEDLPLHDWLCDRIWPLEAAYNGKSADGADEADEADEADGYVAARLTIAEMLKSGTTCFLEAMLTSSMGLDNVVRAVQETGVRACLGKLVKVAESAASRALATADPRDAGMNDSASLAALDAAYAAHHGSCDGRVHVWAACSTPRGAPLESFAAVGAACGRRQMSCQTGSEGVAGGASGQTRVMGITMHCAEAPADLPIFRRLYGGRSPMQFCQEAGLTGPRTVLAHMCHLDLAVDLPILARTGTSVAHNPTSNLKLASGLARLPEMLAAGVNVGLGTDGAPCNNTHDMLREMHLASILHRGRTLNAATGGAHTALEMATLHGAVALGLDGDVGSLEAGKKADLVVLDARGCWAAPWDPSSCAEGGCDPVTVVVGCCTGRDVELVMVDGRLLVEDGALVHLDEAALVSAAQKAIRGIQSRSGVRAPLKPNWHYE